MKKQNYRDGKSIRSQGQGGGGGDSKGTARGNLAVMAWWWLDPQAHSICQNPQKHTPQGINITVYKPVSQPEKENNLHEQPKLSEKEVSRR